MNNHWLNEKEFDVIVKKYPIGSKIDDPSRGEGVIEFWTNTPKDLLASLGDKFMALVSFKGINSLFYPSKKIAEFKK